MAAPTPALRLGLAQDVFRLAPDQGHFKNRPIIGFTGKQTNKADFTGWLTIRAVPFNADIIHIGATVYLGFEIGLGNRNRIGHRHLTQHLL